METEKTGQGMQAPPHMLGRVVGATAADGTAIRCFESGQGHPLLLIPGLGGSARVWGPFPRTLGTWFRAISYDPRGFGGTQALPGSISMESMVSDALSVLDGLCVEKGHVLGISMGGIVAQRLAASHPDRVSRLVLVSTTGGMTPWSRRVLEMFGAMARRLEPREFSRMLAAFSLSPEYFDSGPNRAADLEASLTPSAPEMASILAQIRALEALGDRGAGGGGRVPTLILAGRRDFLTPAACAEDLHRSIEGSRLFWLEGGHACLMENTEEGMVEILSFLRYNGPSADVRRT